jgi:hypothetical protein
MKKGLLFLLGGLAFGASAQNVTDNKVSFTYIQLPTNPIDSKYTQFEIVVLKSFENSNQDSLNAYQIKLDNVNMQYESAMNVWKEQKKNVDRNYLMQMAAWEKSTNAAPFHLLLLHLFIRLNPSEQICQCQCCMKIFQLIR